MHKNQWQNALSNLIKDPKELFDYLQLDANLLDGAYQAIKSFPLRVPLSYASRMEKGNPHDPLLKQVLPIFAELMPHANYSNDPLKELSANPLKGLLHKYQGRVLLTLTSACAVHCRYCFRRHFPYNNNNPGRRGWQEIFSYIKNDTSIHEVILSGGDPLTLSDEMLNQFSDELSKIQHVRRLRLHTRLPIVLPERISDDFCDWLIEVQTNYENLQNIIIVVHANHPNEIDHEVKNALVKMAKSGVTVLNQTVLLKDINDNALILKSLSEKLFTAKVIPYYLHLLDKVNGAEHFDIALEKARLIYQELQSMLPGYLVPRLVREEAARESKTLII